MRVAVRVISATNQDLASMVSRQQYREDLYYRLSVVPIRIPPLRERVEDIRPLAEYFLQEFCARNNFKQKTLGRSGLPGVRELSLAGQRAGAEEHRGTDGHPDPGSGFGGRARSRPSCAKRRRANHPCNRPARAPSASAFCAPSTKPAGTSPPPPAPSAWSAPTCTNASRPWDCSGRDLRLHAAAVAVEIDVQTGAEAVALRLADLGQPCAPVSKNIGVRALRHQNHPLRVGAQ